MHKSLLIFLQSITLILLFSTNSMADPKTVTVSGNITDAAQDPLADAYITILNNSDTLNVIQTNSQGFYTFQLSVDFNTGINIPESFKYGVSTVYPNPVTNTVNPVIYYRSPMNVDPPTLQIYDIMGQLISPPYQLSAGTYFYKLVFPDNITSQTKAFTVNTSSKLSFNVIPESRQYNNAGNYKSAFLNDPIQGNSISLIIEKQAFETVETSLTLDQVTVSYNAKLTQAKAPSAGINVQGNLRVGTPITFDGSGSEGKYGEPLKYTWQINGKQNGHFNKVSKIFMHEGANDVTLIVHGKYGAKTEIQKSYDIYGPENTGAGAEVLGRVTDINGEPIGNVEVKISGRDSIRLTMQMDTTLLQPTRF